MFKTVKKSPGPLFTLPSWLFIGFIMVLLGIIVTMAIRDLNRNRDSEIQTLMEKSAVLIRAFESGTRTGIGMRWRREQRQALLQEMTYQPGVLYIAVTDPSGRILAHSNPDMIGRSLYSESEMKALQPGSTEQWRMTRVIDENNDGQNAFEVYRYFKPMARAGHRGHMGMMHRPPPEEATPEDDAQEPQVVFAAFDTSALDAMQAKDLRNTGVSLAILALLALAGVLAMFWARRYQLSSRELQVSRTFSGEIISHLPVGLIMTDAQSRIGVVNQAAEKILAADSASLCNRDIAQALPAQWKQLAEISQRQRPVIEQELDIRLSDGRLIPLSISVAGIKSDDGGFLGNVFLFRDMREVRQLQEEVRRKEKMAAIGNLAAGVAHEIRNPLSSIKGFAKYFEGRSAQGSEERELAQVMTKEVDRLNRVVTELLELVRPSDLKEQLVNLNDVIDHSLLLIRQDAQARGIALRFTRNDALPDVNIDPDRFTQALLNLYLNAIQAIDREGVLSVTLENAQEGGINVIVQDSGKGIEPEDLANIFNPYFTTKASGTGLGLTIVQKVIEEHQGKISVTSRLREGTQFTMNIPVRRETGSQIEEASGNDEP
ncbi:ATP-binding protein [Leminorella grimontii]|uniref:ATP-binding protein n=1 Tax=Leminorella grimontii TaxID=82981 RepID=UPI00208D345D|nr:ATP-binding protein [Leminorella grimontii]GKX60945.1 hypothetical protein SOASR031_32600 [Leminorella grimontii]